MKICVFFWWWSSHQNGESGQSMWRNFLWAFFHQVATIMAECHICRIYIVNIVTPIITNHYQIHFTLNKQPLSFIKIIVIGINTLWLCNCIENKYHKGSFKEKAMTKKKENRFEITWWLFKCSKMKSHNAIFQKNTMMYCLCLCLCLTSKDPVYLVLLSLSLAGRLEHLLMVTIKAVFSKLYFTYKTKLSKT